MLVYRVSYFVVAGSGLWCIALIWLLYTPPARASINCYTCSSVNGSDPYCEDPINTQVSKYTEKCMVPKKGHIGVFPANFCIKIVGKNTDTYERLVIRACVMKTMDSQCGMFRYQQVAMTGCVLTCDYDGCNHSDKPATSWSHHILAALTVWTTMR